MKDKAVGIASVLIAAFLLFTLRNEEAQTMLFPLLLVLALLVISVFLILRKNGATYELGDLKTLLLVGAAFSLYIIAMPHIGFLIATTLFLGSFLLIVKFNLKPAAFVLVSIGISITTWFVFAILFRVQLPEILF
jgi:putative tricarboxylic transport membrane protein